MITKDKMHLVGITLSADVIAKCAHAAYWLYDKPDGAAALVIQEDEVMREFLRVAELLGYRVEKIEDDLAQAAE